MPPTPAADRQHQVHLAILWLALSAALMMVIISTLVKAAIQTDFSEFVHHPGPQGWAVFCIQFFVYVAMGAAVLQVGAGWFRWLNVGLLALLTVFMALHQVGHMREGWVYGWTGLVDGAHHLVGGLATWQAWKWARLRVSEAQPQRIERAAANA